MRDLRERNLDVVVTRWNTRNAVLIHRQHPWLRHKRLEPKDLPSE